MEEISNKIDPNKRPEWPYTEITESDFRRVHNMGMIVEVAAKWEFTSVDTTKEWLEATSISGKTTKLPESWKKILEFVGYACSPGLFQYTYLGKRCMDTMKLIDEWEKQHEADRAEFERLKAKFGS